MKMSEVCKSALFTPAELFILSVLVRRKTKREGQVGCVIHPTADIMYLQYTVRQYIYFPDYTPTVLVHMLFTSAFIYYFLFLYLTSGLPLQSPDYIKVIVERQRTDGRYLAPNFIFSFLFSIC